ALDRARRSMDRHSVFWLANNLAEAFHEIGRLPEALAMHLEVVAAARAMGLGGRAGTGHGGHASMCWTLIQMGRLGEARQVWEEIKDDAPEPQAMSWWASIPAALGWSQDPAGSVGIIEKAAGGDLDLYHTALMLLARMAVRIDRDQALRIAASSLEEQASAIPGSPTALSARWATALALSDSAAAAGTVAGIAPELEALGHPLQAADAYADAAWLAERAGIQGGGWSEQAAALYAACSAVPLLDPALQSAQPITAARHDGC
ncbi:MAG: hypothetical protein LC744_06785, partial [Chloroflexi bacterium]|nr:hypothetical protein [Chloroflexota bacterium]